MARPSERQRHWETAYAGKAEDDAAISKELGGDFSLEEERSEAHVTPGGAAQPYRYFRFMRP